MNKTSLRVVLLNNQETQGDLADFLGISQQTLSRKINEKKGSEFSRTEIEMIKDRYNLSAEDIDRIFFKQLVS